MKKLLLLLFVLSIVSTPVFAQEYRAFWADGFNEGFKTPAQVDTLLTRLRAAHCNTIIAQMRKRGDAYYLSRYDPWATDDTNRFDALAYLIDKAHHGSPRIQVIAWLNTCAVGGMKDNPFHISTAHPEWLSLSDKQDTYDNEATKIDLGNPDAADWTFRVYLDVLRHYAVDGVHFDFVRYGGPNWGYNPVNVARFNAAKGRTGLPAVDDPVWKQWRRDQVTAFVRKVYAMAAQVNPKAAIAAATITWGDGPQDMAFWNEKSAPMNRTYQDWRAWMQEGILDLNCLMSYYQEKRHPDFFKHWIDWAKDHQYNRYAIIGSGIWFNPIPDSLKQIQLIRAPSAAGHRPHGVLLYSYAGTNSDASGSEVQYGQDFYNSLSQPSTNGNRPPFVKPVAAPALPWKEHPTRGHLKGFVLNAGNLTPVDGASLTITGRGIRRQMTSDGTGFYASIDLPSGAYRLRLAAKGRASQEQRITVSKGQVTTRNFFVGVPPAPFVELLENAPARSDGAPIECKSALVVGGTDIFPGNLYVRSWPRGAVTYRVRLAQPPIVPFQAGDVVALKGEWATIDGERAIDNAAARLVDMRSPGETWTAALTARRSDGPLPQRQPYVTVTGNVVDVLTDRVIVDNGGRVEVMLADRKDPGVEAPLTALPAPAVGSRIRVTGLVTAAKDADGEAISRLRPRTAEDIQALASAGVSALKAVGWSAVGFFRPGASVLRMAGLAAGAAGTDRHPGGESAAWTH